LGDTVDCTYTNHINLSPTISTTLSATTVNIGDPVHVGSTVHNSATLSCATADAAGTVTYTVYTDNKCSAGARDAGTVTVTGGIVPDSSALAFNSAGMFYWQAVYSGDAKNDEHNLHRQRRGHVAVGVEVRQWRWEQLARADHLRDGEVHDRELIGR
jgi:hypothetical protein